jgi:transcriptional regulator with XRE-family HTH domain
MVNERIKELRNLLDLSQEKFGTKLGVTKAAISRMEKGVYNITDTMIRIMCSEFGVNEEWLRSGEGEMFKEDDFAYDLGTYAAKATELDKAIITEWMKLDDSTKHNLYEFMKKVVDSSNK